MSTKNISKKSVAKKAAKKVITKALSPKAAAKTLWVGKKAPPFSLPSTSGENVSLKKLLGQRVVLYFYPKDMTSGCTIEAQEFSVIAKKFAKKGVLVYGVSPDSVASHEKFIAKEKITFPLLADVDHAVATKYGVWVEKSMYGKKYMGIERTTFVIDAEGKVERVYNKVKPEGHAVCVLNNLK